MIKFDFAGEKPDGYFVRAPDIKLIKEFPGYAALRSGHILRINKLRVQKAFNNGNGYFRVHISKVKEKQYIHRLVASAYLPNKENKPQVNHKNGNKSDNRVENLEWVTRCENVQHSYDSGLRDAETTFKTSLKLRINPYKDLPMRPYRWNRSYEVARYICDQGISRSFNDIGKELGMHRTQVAKYFFQERYKYYPEHKKEQIPG